MTVLNLDSFNTFLTYLNLALAHNYSTLGYKIWSRPHHRIPSRTGCASASHFVTHLRLSPLLMIWRPKEGVPLCSRTVTKKAFLLLHLKKACFHIITRISIFLLLCAPLTDSMSLSLLIFFISTIIDACCFPHWRVSFLPFQTEGESMSPNVDYCRWNNNFCLFQFTTILTIFIFPLFVDSLLYSLVWYSYTSWSRKKKLATSTYTISRFSSLLFFFKCLLFFCSSVTKNGKLQVRLFLLRLVCPSTSPESLRNQPTGPVSSSQSAQAPFDCGFDYDRQDSHYHHKTVEYFFKCWLERQPSLWIIG